jgi:hypothetical protein
MCQNDSYPNYIYLSQIIVVFLMERLQCDVLSCNSTETFCCCSSLWLATWRFRTTMVGHTQHFIIVPFGDKKAPPPTMTFTTVIPFKSVIPFPFPPLHRLQSRMTQEVRPRRLPCFPEPFVQQNVRITSDLTGAWLPRFVLFRFRRIPNHTPQQ